jgi:hypothetical protein
MKLIITDYKDKTEVLSIDLNLVDGVYVCDKTPQYKTYDFMLKPVIKQINKNIFEGVFRDNDQSPIYATWNFYN